MRALMALMETALAQQRLPMGAKGAWYANDGQIIPIGASHEQTAKRFYPHLDPDKAFAQALKDRWVRVTYPLDSNDGFGFFALDRGDLVRAMRAHLRDLRGHRVDVEWGFNPDSYDLYGGTYRVLNNSNLTDFLAGN